uniref:Small ribosomal subunit protein uS3c n=1 Tax=Malawimonas jakobiformis TaxID=136089 RepID=Q9G889_MALJA|nr:ribosomal protein S3 [Malawimonas jakobiformis]AAG13684.1 ribosomal protein S3 [Malawimonas jakobiformis]
MGQSINTTGLLLTHNKYWQSKWYNDNNYIFSLYEDILIRNYIKNVFKNLNLFYGKCVIKRSIQKIYIYINIYKKKRKNIINTKDKRKLINKKEIKQILQSLTKLTNNRIILIIKPTNIFDAQLLAQYISRKLEIRNSFLSIFKKILNKINKNKKIYKGFRIQCSGRPNGNDMAYIQWFKYGQIPLHTYNYKIDYAYTTALTKYGLSGVKVWLSFV